MSIQNLRDLLNSLGSSDFTAESFVSCFNELQELSIKNIKLPDDVKISLIYHQQRFMVRNLAQNSQPKADEEDLLKSIDRLIDAFEALKLNANDVLDVDDETLLRMKLILGELCLLRDSERLALIPLEEMAFCVTLFILVFKEKEEYRAFRLILNRVNVTKFLRAIVSSLQDYRKGKFEANARRKVFKKLVKIYRVVHKLHILHSIKKNISALVDHNTNENTKLVALYVMLEKVKQNRKYFEEPINIYKLLEPCFEKYEFMSKRLKMFETISNIIIIFQVNTVLKHFLNAARSCQTTKELRSLFRYVENLDLVRQGLTNLHDQIVIFLKGSETASRLGSSSNLRSLKCLTELNVPHFNRLLYDENFELNIEHFVNVVDAYFVEINTNQVKNIVKEIWRSLKNEISFDKPIESDLASPNWSESLSIDKNTSSVTNLKKG